jgi:hypothetical protein
LAAKIIATMAMHTASIMIPRWLDMPTAVMTASRENTMSSTTIWTIVCQNFGGVTGPSFRKWGAFEFLVQLHRGLEQQERASDQKDQVSP